LHAIPSYFARVAIPGSLALLAVSLGCRKPDTKEVTTTRTVMSGPVLGEVAPDTSRRRVAHADHEAPVAWELPAGWESVNPTPIRVGNFRVAAAPGVECYVTVLTGAGGGVLANINRWRQQMGQGELSQAQADALPAFPVLGAQAVFLDAAGDFTDMSGTTQSGYRMLGIVAPLPDRTVFVKMTGPDAAVLGEKERFIEFCKSLEETQPH